MITIIAGTNRNNAVSRILADIYQDILLKLDQKASIIDLNELPDDFISSALYDQSGKNRDFNPLRQQMLDSDKYVFIIPEYNGSFPGVLKTFIDGLEFPGTFTGKKAALVGLSAGVQGGGLALSHLTDILNYCGTHVLALKPKLAQISKNLEGETITNALYLQLLKDQAKQIIEF